jgi:hypothetical protein
MPFEGGGPAVTALVGGETPAHVAANSELIAHVEANRVRALADPLPALPPRSDHRRYDPPPRCSRPPGHRSRSSIEATIASVLKDPATVEPASRSADDRARRMQADHETIGNLHRQIGVKVDWRPVPARGSLR